MNLLAITLVLLSFSKLVICFFEIASTDGNTIKIWKEEQNTRTINGLKVDCLVLITEKYLASCEDEDSIDLWDISNLNRYNQFSVSSSSLKTIVQINNDILAFGTSNGDIQFLNAPSLTTANLVSNLDSVKSLKLSKKIILVCLLNIDDNIHEIKFLNLTNYGFLPYKIRLNNDQKKFEVVEDNHLIYLLSNVLFKYHILTNNTIYNFSFDVVAGVEIKKLKYLSNKLTAVGFSNGTIQLWDFIKITKNYTLFTDLNSIIDLEEANFTLGASGYQRIWIWDLNNLTNFRIINAHPNEDVKAIVFIKGKYYLSYFSKVESIRLERLKSRVVRN